MLNSSNSTIWHLVGKRAVEGDADAIGKLLQAYRAAMTNIAQRRIPASVRQQVGASDVVQQTCTDVCGSIHGVKAATGDQLWSWIVSLLLKNIVDIRRRLISCKKRSVLRELPGHASGAANMTQTTREKSAIESLIAREDIECIAAALDRLPEGYATVLRWHYHDQQSLVEIAKRVDRTPDAIRMLVRRAEAALFRELRGWTGNQRD